MLRRKEAGHFREVAGVFIIDVAVRVRGRHFNSRQLSGLNKLQGFFQLFAQGGTK